MTMEENVLKKIIDLNSLTLEEKVGQMIGLAFSGTEYSSELKMQVEDMKVGLIIFFKDNCGNPKQIFELNKQILKNAKIPPFIALDQEGGMVARVTEKITQSPGAMAISATGNSHNAYQLAYNMGKEMKELGFNFNFAPDADINNNPLNPVINVRSYSENPDVVCEYVRDAVRGYTDAGMMTSIKHFPGHGDTSVDSHIGLPKVDFTKERLYQMELKPFIKAKEEDWPGIMSSHVMFTTYDETYPTTMSKNILTGLLREEIGYNGLVVTDSLTMSAVYDNHPLDEIVYRTFNAGNDIMLLCGARNIDMQKQFYDTAIRLAKEGKISLDLINTSVERILKYKAMFAHNMKENFTEVEPLLCNKKAVEFSEKVSLDSITLIKDERHLIPITKDEKTLIVFPKIKVVTLVENDENGGESLAEYMPFTCDKAYMPLAPSVEEQEQLIKKANDYDKVVYCSYNACFNASQAELINSLDRKKLIVIAIRTPYDYRVLNNLSTYLCSYEATPLAFKALAKVLTGKKTATGVSPVTITEDK